LNELKEKIEARGGLAMIGLAARRRTDDESEMQEEK